MKLLIAIPSTNNYRGNIASTNRNEPQRRKACAETWLRNCPVDYRFFCDDAGYDGLSLKMVRMAQWAMRHDYTHLFRVDTDAYVYVDRLLRSGFEKHEYTGYCINYPKWNEPHRYACGAGFVLGPRAIEVVAKNVPDHPADDLWVGRVLFRDGIKCFRDTRYLTGFDNHYVDLEKLGKFHPYIVLHALSPEGIREVHGRGDAGYPFEPPIKPLNEPDYEAQWRTRI